MRSWFIIGCKLLGIYFLYRFIKDIGTILIVTILFINFIYSRGIETYDMMSETLLTLIVYTFILFLFTLLLLFRSNWVASFLKLSDDISFPMPKGKSALRGGVILIGLYLFVTRIGSLAGVIYKQFIVDNVSQDVVATYPSILKSTEGVIAPIITIVFALILMFGSNFIVRIIDRTKHTVNSETK